MPVAYAAGSFILILRDDTDINMINYSEKHNVIRIGTGGDYEEMVCGRV
jgi:hypothetical protein